ncbi:geranylgeranylglycerol-phosphate geranylgeranyltransferase [Paracrocinitomix mangrovi]|uniref:geranylgeranylglycerol-phosphate geranylgeranyltransferase n=1 Tax=Paracrocinitomix mangrovi TaxID=2862509 RepID=UPI001C8E57F2|nr:geranylgeranylglycerol-phosphate geranylgeranyltransferase [Paracrocinitomix mangrovi]UKN01453.1 geranylgeranylglycerol-phosphate geranylgeranyltransferase [Paracrocinitomix mangrovi]
MVIAVTMCIIQSFIATHGNNKEFVPQFHSLSAQSESSGFLASNNFNLDFFLLIISVVLIAGAGNIINDYFDIKADRVNKPEKMVVEKHIKRRWAIVWNWIFNSVGLFIATYLAWIHSNMWVALIAFITINFLWFYSALYKRRIFVGNILVALLVGIVPIYVMIYNFPLKAFYFRFLENGQTMYIEIDSFFVVKVVVIIATIAFVINLMREIIKDMADIRGDMHLSARTVPISLGIKTTKTILILMLIPLLALMAFYIYDIISLNNLFSTNSLDEIINNSKGSLFINISWFVLFVVLSAVICLISFGILLTANSRSRYLISSNLLKLAMLFGMVSPLFL